MRFWRATKAKPLPRFEEELREPADDRGFEVGFAQAFVIGEVEEIEYQRRFHQVDGIFHGLALAGQFHYARLVAALEQAQVELGVDLAFEVGDGPVLAGGFDFVEGAGGRIRNLAQDEVVEPPKTARKPGKVGISSETGFGRRLVPNWGAACPSGLSMNIRQTEA